MHTSFEGTLDSIGLFVHSPLLLPLRRLHRMLGQVILDHDVLLLLHIGAVRLQYQQLSFLELGLG